MLYFMKRAAGFRLSLEALRLLALLAAKLGISQASTLELAIREMAKRNKVSSDKKKGEIQ